MTRTMIGYLNFFLFCGATLAALNWGWSERNEYWLSPEQGLGYYLGIVGTTMMILLLLYPLRKKLRMMRGLLPVRYWFKAHMILGVVGPVLILFHCNFSLGSTNSNVALFCMLLVVFSGLIGRFIFRHTHSGLYGKKLHYDELRSQYANIRSLMDERQFAPEVLANLTKLEDLSTAHNTSLAHSFRSVLQARSMSMKLHRSLKRQQTLNLQTPDGQQLVMQELSQHLKKETKVLRTMVGLSFYNRLFSLWHIAHLPFFMMMVLTAIAHVIVVHMY